METEWLGPYTIKALCGKNLVELERNDEQSQHCSADTSSGKR